MSAPVSSCPAHWNKTIYFCHEFKWSDLRVCLGFFCWEPYLFIYQDKGLCKTSSYQKCKGEPCILRVARATYSSSLGETQIPFIQFTFENSFFPKGIMIRKDHHLSPFSEMGCHKLLEHSACICTQVLNWERLFF